MLEHDHFYSFKHHAYVEPCIFSISLAASSISEIWANPKFRVRMFENLNWSKKTTNSQIETPDPFPGVCSDYGGYTLRSVIEAPLITREVFAGNLLFVGDYGS
jgi:hypothetical protein